MTSDIWSRTENCVLPCECLQDVGIAPNKPDLGGGYWNLWQITGRDKVTPLWAWPTMWSSGGKQEQYRSLFFPIPPPPFTSRYKLDIGQNPTRLWGCRQSNPFMPHYNIPAGLRLLNRESLQLQHHRDQTISQSPEYSDNLSNTTAL